MWDAQGIVMKINKVAFVVFTARKERPCEAPLIGSKYRKDICLLQ